MKQQSLLSPFGVLYPNIRKLVSSLLILSVWYVFIGIEAGASQSLEDIKNTLIDFEVEQPFQDTPDGGCVLVLQTAFIYQGRKRIARANPEEEFKSFGLDPQKQYYLVEFELKGRTQRGYIPVGKVQWYAVSAEGRSEFNRILKQYKLFKTTKGYAFEDILKGNDKILKGRAKINEGKDLIGRGEMFIARTSIDARTRPYENQGRQMVSQGKSAIEEGNRMISDGGKMLEVAQAEEEIIYRKLSSDLDQVVESAFEEADYESVIEYALIAKELGVESEEMLEYKRTAKKVMYYVSGHRNAGDAAASKDQHLESYENYSKALQLVPDERALVIKREKAVKELKKQGMVQYEGKWMKTEEAEKLEMKAKGLVEYEGEWITPAQKEKREKAKGGLVPFRGTFVTAEKKESIEMFEKGYVEYKDKWMKPEEKERQEKIDAGLVQLPDGKWVPKEEQEETDAKAEGKVKYKGEWVTPEEKEKREKAESGMVDHNGRQVDAKKLNRIQRELETVYQVDEELTLDELKKRLQPEKEKGTVVNWELTIKSFSSTTGNRGIYKCGDVEFEWTEQPELKRDAKVRVVGEFVKIDPRKVGKKKIKIFILKPFFGKVIFESDPDYIYY